VPGSAFVIEPGLYIREDSLESLGRPAAPNRGGGQGANAQPPATPAPPTIDPAAVLAKVRPVFEEYKNIGIRIEDSFLMTEAGPIMLSAKAPRQIAEIEKIVGTGR